jgi:hypothetical protein
MSIMSNERKWMKRQACRRPLYHVILPLKMPSPLLVAESVFAYSPLEIPYGGASSVESSIRDAQDRVLTMIWPWNQDVADQPVAAYPSTISSIFSRFDANVLGKICH